MPNLLGSLLGLIVGFFLGACVAVAAAVQGVVPFSWFVALAQAPLGGMSVGQIMWLTAFLTAIVYLVAYVVATAAVAPLITPPPGIALADAPGELAARGFTVGLTAALNLSLLYLLLPICLVGASPGFFCTVLSAALITVPPWFWPVLPVAVLLVHWLCAFPAISRNPFFQVLVGWISWIAPMSYIATGVGFLLFLVNLPFALIAFGLGAFRINFLSATIETTGGIQSTVARAFGYPGAATAVGAYSLGNFNFVVPATVGPQTGLLSQSNFVGPTISAHEIGHTLNTSAMGGVVLWINAIDENIPPFRRGALAYGELLAESHSFQPGRNAVRIWG
jgi:hypothetical protein